MSERDLGTLSAIVSRTQESACPEAEAISVLFVAAAGPTRDHLVDALALRGAAVECVSSSAEVSARAAREDAPLPNVVFVDLGMPDATSDALFVQIRQSFPHAAVVALGAELNCERAARLLGLGVPSLPAPSDSAALAGLAFRLSSCLRPSVQPESGTTRKGTHEGGSDFAGSIEAYIKARNLSTKQRTILRLYLAGSNDKAIAEDCGCSVATVYEHWRRMAKKVGGAQKGDVIADFHRFLDIGTRRPEPQDGKSE
jgi:DNA-binding NarL/FixJ family response regulator